jgi:hypothetical protein
VPGFEPSRWVPWCRVRQLFSIRLVAAIGALAAIGLVLNAVLIDDEPLEAVVEPATVERDIDLIAPIFALDQSVDFGIDQFGVTSGYMDIVLDGERSLRIAPGTLGEISCEELDAINRCALFADLLGEAVVWFAVLPQTPDGTVELGGIVDLDDGDAVFEQGWRIPYPPVIERACNDADIASFSDFLAEYGPDSITTIDLSVGEVSFARCAEHAEGAPTSTTSTTIPPLDQLPDAPTEEPEG